MRLAAAIKRSMDAAVGAVLSKLDSIFILKEQRTEPKVFLVEKMFRLYS